MRHLNDEMDEFSGVQFNSYPDAVGLIILNSLGGYKSINSEDDPAHRGELTCGFSHLCHKNETQSPLVSESMASPVLVPSPPLVSACLMVR